MNDIEFIQKKLNKDLLGYGIFIDSRELIIKIQSEDLIIKDAKKFIDSMYYKFFIINLMWDYFESQQ